jgi:hypothetical protein
MPSPRAGRTRGGSGPLAIDPGVEPGEGAEVAQGAGVQALAQIVALTGLRRRQPGLRRPYRQWLYPIPSLVAFGDWIYVYTSAGSTPIIFSLVVLAVGLIAFVIWARLEHNWPFGPKRIREDFLSLAQDGSPGPPGARPCAEAAQA